MIDLAGKTALVTGAGTRVGAAIAEALGGCGMRVGIAYHRSRDGAERTAAHIESDGGSALLLQGDLTTPTGARALGTQAVEQLGGIDVLVPSAANFEAVALGAIDDGHWERALGLNLRAPFELVQCARASLVARRGAVVFITGYSTRVPYRGYLPYIVSKGAVRQMMRALSLELAPYVRVNAVAPGTVIPPEDYSEAQIASLVERVPLGCVGSGEDVAEAVVYLARAPYVTGQELFVDGGRTLA